MVVVVVVGGVVVRTRWCVVGSMVLVVREDECNSPMNHRDSLVVVVVDEGQEE